MIEAIMQYWPVWVICGVGIVGITGVVFINYLMEK